MIKISFHPFDLSDSNLYVSRVCQAINRAYPTVEILPFVITKKLHFSFSSDVFWLNWYEDLGQKGKTSTVKYLILKLMYLFLMKISRGKIVIVLHNKRSHEVVLSRLNFFFMRLLLNSCDKIVVLCTEGISVANQLAKKNVSKKICKILHPSYVCLPKEYANKQSERFSILFFGRLRPYKNIELLIDIAQKYTDIDFVIAGEPINKTYGELLLQKTRLLQNVSLELKFITNTEIEVFMDRASVLVLPYHLASTLNSGVAMYAFSKGMNVVMPNIGTVTELNNKSFVFGYEYTTEEQHRIVLEEKINEAYFMYRHNYAEFVHRAEIVRDEVLTRCSIEAISQQIKECNILGI